MEYDQSGRALGFIELAARGDYVNGTESSPVAFLEGIYVEPSARRRGIAGKLVAAAEQWAKEYGCKEFASDAAIDNIQSHAMHKSPCININPRRIADIKAAAAAYLLRN
nr:GNAT family N-acetyltransferase [Iodobacter ciconiae]